MKKCKNKRGKPYRYDLPNNEIKRKNLATLRLCPYCGSKVKFISGEELENMVNNHPKRGKDKPPFVSYHKHYYVCGNFNECQSYIGAYENTYDPMGEMANKELRLLRIHAHLVFDEVWRKGIWTKDEAYAFLADKLSLKKRQTHISQFNIYHCRKTIEISSEVLKKHGYEIPDLNEFFERKQMKNNS